MADKYAQGGVTTEGNPTPTTIRAGEYAIHWRIMHNEEDTED